MKFFGIYQSVKLIIWLFWIIIKLMLSHYVEFFRILTDKLYVSC